jgi:uncharacterized protein
MATSRGPAASPFVVSVRDLARRPGSQLSISRTVPAPAVFGTEVIGVPEGSDLALELSMESVSEGIWVSGTVAASAVGECSRCLNEVREEVLAPVQGLFAHPGAESAGEGDDVDVRDFDGESLDIEELLRDAVVTSLPFVPLCEPDCPGLCDQCGALLADDPGHHHDVVDPRWAALEGLNDQKET